LGLVRDELMQPTALAILEAEIQTTLNQATANQASEAQALKEREASLYKEIDNLVQALALVGASAAIAARLQAAE
jgi:hypothetical protein